VVGVLDGLGVLVGGGGSGVLVGPVVEVGGIGVGVFGTGVMLGLGVTVRGLGVNVGLGVDVGTGDAVGVRVETPGGRSVMVGGILVLVTVGVIVGEGVLV